VHAFSAWIRLIFYASVCPGAHLAWHVYVGSHARLSMSSQMCELRAPRAAREEELVRVCMSSACMYSAFFAVSTRRCVGTSMCCAYTRYATDRSLTEVSTQVTQRHSIGNACHAQTVMPTFDLAWIKIDGRGSSSTLHDCTVKSQYFPGSG